MKTRSCTTCMFKSAPIGPDGKIAFNQMICRFNPPVPAPVPMGNGIGQLNIWPGVVRGDWCGQYSPTAQAEDVLPGSRPLLAQDN